MSHKPILSHTSQFDSGPVTHLPCWQNTWGGLRILFDWNVECGTSRVLYEVMDLKSESLESSPQHTKLILGPDRLVHHNVRLLCVQGSD